MEEEYEDPCPCWCDMCGCHGYCEEDLDEEVEDE
jgi:hypothetical protein